MVFHEEMGIIIKEAKNDFAGNYYATLSNILNGIKEPLKKANLVYVQFPTEKFGLTTRLMCEDEFMEATYFMSPKQTQKKDKNGNAYTDTGDDPQGMGSVITYQRRYALGAILGLNIDIDDDGNKGSKREESNYQNMEKHLKKEPPKQNPTVENLKGKINEVVNKTPRPYKPEQLLTNFKENLNPKFDFEITKETLITCEETLNILTMNNNDKRRKLIMYLTGQESLADIKENEAKRIIKWINPTINKATGETIPDFDTMKEYESIINLMENE